MAECFETTQSYLINLFISEDKTRIDNQVKDCANVGEALIIHRGEEDPKVNLWGKINLNRNIPLKRMTHGETILLLENEFR